MGSRRPQRLLQAVVPVDPESKPTSSHSPAQRVDRRRSEHRARCTICTHADRSRIELALARGAGRRAVARRYSVSPDAVWRHWNGHVSDTVKAARKLEVLRPGAELSKLLTEEDTGLLENLRVVRTGLLHQFDLAVELDNPSGCAVLAAQLHKNLEIVGKHTGELRRHDTLTVAHLALTPDFLDFRLKLIQALRP
jgi:hypothetical protein